MSPLTARPTYALAAVAALAGAAIPGSARAQSAARAVRAASHSDSLAPDQRLPRPFDDAAPTYPEAMLRNGVDGDVLAEFVVAADGRPRMRGFVVVESSGDPFTAAVRDAVAQSRYIPGEDRGAPVPMAIRRVYRFRIVRGVARAAGAAVTAPAAPGFY